MVIAEIDVAEKRAFGGKQPGAGRPRLTETEFSLWAKTKGYSAQDLADRLGVSVSTTRRLLSENMRPSLELAAKIAELSTEPGQPPKFPSEYWLKIPKYSKT